jgi:uncharacterized RDD family membrane protein YckC
VTYPSEPPGAYPGPEGGPAQSGASAAVPGVPAGIEVADMGQRLLARLVDLGIALVIGLILIVPGFAMSEPGQLDPATGQITGGSLSPLVIIGYLVLFAFGIYNEIVLMAQRGQSIGKRVIKVKAVRTADGTAPGFGGALIRYIVLAITGSLCFIGYLSPFFDNSGRRQGWHDKAANTIVIKAA